jgi:toxin ParE1/3/4
MTARALLSPRAQRDIEEIWDFTEARWGATQAESYVRQIWHQAELIGATPSIGRRRPDVRRGYFSAPCGSHVLFDKKLAAGIVVVRILHGRMDPKQHL